MRRSSVITTLLSLVILAVASSAQTGGGTWQALARMPSARQEVSSAVLNGKVYVIAGYDLNGRSTSTVEVYNPNTNTWASAAPLPVATNHNAAATVGGKLYAFGAQGRRTYVYDPGGDSWSAVAPSLFLHGRTAAVGVLNEKIYVAGGTGGTQRELEVYDPVANTWRSLAPMNVPRNHCAGAMIDGKFYVVGGRDSAKAPTALERYNPQTNNWTSLAPMPSARSGLAAAAVNGELWVFGGEGGSFLGQVEVYNTGSNTWRRLPNMPTPRHGIWASVIGNKIYLAGGATEPGFAATATNDVFIVDRKATFANISSRLKVETLENVLIGGFIVTGSTSKRIIVRAVGPSVTAPGQLADPVLELYDDAGRLVASNDNWQDAPNKQEIVDSTLAPTQSSEAAILTRVSPGNHTAVVQGANRSTGVGLVEVYDLEAGSDAKLANISTRGFVQTGDDVLIGGLILTGNEPLRVIVRAIGPTLRIPGALANPTLELRDANGALLAGNDDWRSTQESEIIATTIPPSSDLEAAIVRTLPPAHYTAIVQGAGGTTGVALVEAYALE